MSFRPLPILTIATLAALAVLIGLGVWQLQRRTEKHAQLDQIAARSGMAPAPIEILLATGDYAAHRPATAIGTFDHAKETYVYHPRADQGPTRQGKKVLTPFELTSGGVILVDRGWVDESWPSRDESLREPKGIVEIEGLLRPSSRSNAFTPPADTAKRLFFVRDGEAIAKAAGVRLKTTLVFEMTKRFGNPEPLPSMLNIPDNHLNYALTWFALAAVLLVIYFRYHFVRGRLKFKP